MPQQRPASGPKLDTRLKEVHQTDLTEGRINQDFVDWLKTKGVNYLLALLVALCAYLGWVRWTHHRTSYQAEAWQEFGNASGLPASLEDVASKYDDVGAVPQLARLEAASQVMRAVQSGKPLGSAPPPEMSFPNSPQPPQAPGETLTAEQRAEYLDRADRLYREVLETDDQSAGKTLIAVTALTGRAAVAESRGQVEEAKSLYEQAAMRAEALYPELAAVSRRRAEAVGTGQAPPELPSQADVQAAQLSNPLETTPITVEGWIRELVLPERDDSAG